MQILSNAILEYKKIFPYIRKKRKIQIVFSIILSLVLAITESIGISSLFPFIGSILNPEKIYNIEIIKKLLFYFNVDEKNLVLFFAITFASFVVFSTSLKIILIKINTKISFSLIAEICTDMYNKIISQPYNLYLGRNSSDIIATISNRSSSVGETTFFLITVLSSLFLSIFITVTIFLIAPNEITSLLFFFLIFYFLIFLFIKKKLKNISATISDQSGNVVKLVQESLGSIREILIYKISNFFVPRFIKSNVKLREAMGNMVFITSSPGPLLHLIVIVSIIIFTYYFYSLGVLVDFIPILSAVVFGVQKLVPNINSTFASLASISVQEENLKKISDILNITNSTNYGYFNQKIKNNKNNIKFNNEIEFRNVSFFYNEENTFKLNNITFKIRKGNKIGLKGSSGSGKSTLIDLAMGLLKPSSGDILLDHEKLNHENVNAWQEKIAFVSQDIFLTDESILENITFSDNLKKINYEQINKILKDVNLLDYVNELPNGINSKVGERGSKLSGGQIQRLGIARALHKEREVIILDEATNALDKKNEKIIFDTLYKIKGLTLIVISHNEEIIKNCDQVFSLSEGKLKNLR